MSQMVFHFIPVTMHLWLAQQLEPESAQKCPRRQEKKEKKEANDGAQWLRHTE